MKATKRVRPGKDPALQQSQGVCAGQNTDARCLYHFRMLRKRSGKRGKLTIQLGYRRRETIQRRLNAACRFRALSKSVFKTGTIVYKRPPGSDQVL